MNQYEAMFLFDPTFGSAIDDCESEIRRIMGRADAEVLFLRKWDERRLAYKIKGRKRGVYVLVYFLARPDAITGIERDARLSENVLRLLILRADGVTAEMMEKAAVPGGAAEEVGGDRRPADSTPSTDKVNEEAAGVGNEAEEEESDDLDALLANPADDQVS